MSDFRKDNEAALRHICSQQFTGSYETEEERIHVIAVVRKEKEALTLLFKDLVLSAMIEDLLPDKVETYPSHRQILVIWRAVLESESILKFVQKYLSSPAKVLISEFEQHNRGLCYGIERAVSDALERIDTKTGHWSTK